MMDDLLDLSSDTYFMGEALRQARRAESQDEVPIGAVVVRYGAIIARAWNQVEILKDATAHAEMLVLRAGSAALGNERLGGTTLYVSLEPCAMCAGAISFARVARVVFVAEDPKGGAVLHGPQFFAQPTCHHRPIVARAGDAAAAGEILKGFFRARR